MGQDRFGRQTYSGTMCEWSQTFVIAKAEDRAGALKKRLSTNCLQLVAAALPLTLFMAWVGADDINDAPTTDDFTVGTDSLDACADFHPRIPKFAGSIKAREYTNGPGIFTRANFRGLDQILQLREAEANFCPKMLAKLGKSCRKPAGRGWEQAKSTSTLLVASILF